MSQVTTNQAVAAPAAITEWLASFEEALTAGDIEAAVALFAEECFWRDLVSFSWNIVGNDTGPDAC